MSTDRTRRPAAPAGTGAETPAAPNQGPASRFPLGAGGRPLRHFSTYAEAPAEIGTPAPDALDAVITEGVRPFLHGAVPVRDPGGSLPVRVGGALVLVRALHLGLPLVQAFVPLARGVPSTPALLKALNELNSNIIFGRAFWSGGAVIVAVEVPAVDIPRADQVTLACLQAGSLATRLTKELRDRLGDAFPVAISTNGPEPAN